MASSYTPEQEKSLQRVQQKTRDFTNHADNCDQCRAVDLDDDTKEQSLCPTGVGQVLSIGKAAIKFTRAIAATKKITVGTTTRGIPPVI